MSEGTARRLAWSVWILVAVGAAVSLLFLVLAWHTPAPRNSFGPKGFEFTLGLILGTVGAIVASRRPSNPIGWIFCGGAVLAAIQGAGTSYALWALIDQAGRPPGGTWGAWLDEWTWIPIVASFGVVAAIFPDGRFLSKGWRRVLIAGMVGTAVATVLSAIVPELTIYQGYANPVGLSIESLPTIASASLGLMMIAIASGAASAIVRFRRSSGDERQQLSWLALSITLVALMLVVYGAITIASGFDANPTGLDWAENLMILAMFSVPVAIGIGVLKYRLYDIDLVINRAVVYGALAAFITLVYVAIVVGVGAAIGTTSNAVLSAIAAAVVALAFQPARRRAQHLANRLVYGKRATPYEVLSELSSRFAGTYSVEDALPRLARVIADAVGAERSCVWLRAGAELLPTAGWPDESVSEPRTMTEAELPAFDPSETAFPVRHQGELLGAITVQMPAGEPIGPVQGKLLDDVAAQAGLVLRNVALVEDLRASRKRIVAAQDDRARALERNIHDGAQQQLVAITVKLRLAQGLVTKDPPRAETMLGDLQGETQAALEDLRDLARGIYPPLLADKGLRDAIQAQGRKAALPVTVESDGIGRYPQDVEAAVYFCTLEALQNAAKYAGASTVEVRLAELDGSLEFEIRDDGAGFDPSVTPRGSGLQNMSDRLEAVGGSLELRSAPGSGTAVAGRVPAVREVTR